MKDKFVLYDDPSSELCEVVARIPASQVGLQGAVYIVIRARNVEDYYREEEMPDGTGIRSNSRFSWLSVQKSQT